MQKLNLPSTDKEDDDVISSACNRYSWQVHRTALLAAYDHYRKHGGDPWKIAPLTFDPDIGKDLYGLYDKRKSGGPLKRIRDTKGLLACPVCGSGTAGSLDHYLPRKDFKEFSIMRANLVPACSHCNSGAKGTDYVGGLGERLIHPYYDTWADQDLWLAVVRQPYQSATFEPLPLAHLPPGQKAIVAFHLKTVLATQFRVWTETRWSRLPEMMKLNHVMKSETSVSGFISQELGRAVIAEGRNGWNAALMRGISADAGAVKYLAGLLP